MVFDISVVIVDGQTYQDEKTSFVMTAYLVLIWVQSMLSLTILIGYAILFMFFLLLIHRDKTRFSSLTKQVIGFFSVMLFIMTINFVLDVIFYVQFDKIKEKKGQAAQEKLVSITTYVHTSLEILFDLVLISFLVS